MTTLLAVIAAVLCGCGTYLILQRQLSRIVVGVSLIGHGAVVLLIGSGGGRGDPVFVGGELRSFTDPLPQALALTAIVITFGVIAFLLALAYLSWIITNDDDVEDDLEDRFVARGLRRRDDMVPADDLLSGNREVE